MAIDLELLENRIDKWLESETEESIKEWLLAHRKKLETSDEALHIGNVVGQSERLPCELCSGSGFIHDDYIGTGICSYCNE